MSQPIGSVCCNNEVIIHELLNEYGEHDYTSVFECFECGSFSLHCRN